MGVTIKQIAKLAGVAPTTVSLVLRDSKKVGQETKRRVLRIVEEMDYYPNHSGKLLKQGRSDAIAVVSSYFQNIFKMEFMGGVERAIRDTGLQLRQFYAESGQEPAKCKEILYGKMADAAMALSAIADQALLQKMKAARKPLILVEDVVEGFPGVRFDNYACAYEAVRYLAGKGRRRISISLAMKTYMGHCFVDERLRGYIAALRDLGLAYTDIMELPAYDYESGRFMIDRIMGMSEPPDAIFCASGDLTAASFLKEARLRGMRVPDDVAVLGCDDSVIAHTTTLGLSTIKQPAQAMGEAAVKLALSLIEGDEDSWSRVITFSPELVLRESA